MNKSTQLLYPKLLVELRPSKLLPGEVGLFAVRLLKKGDILASAHRINEERLVTWSESLSLDPPTRNALRKFCASSVEGYRAPADLNFIHPLWYCNHSCDPNVAYDDPGNLHAIRDIEGGEELCFDYASIDRFQPTPAKLTQCKCGASNCRGMVDFL